MGTTTILVVDDERKIRDVVRSYLKLEGYSVLVADSGERTLESCMGSETAIMRLTRPGQGLSDARRLDMPSKSVGGRKLAGGFDSRPPPLPAVVSRCSSGHEGATMNSRR
jgi:CheY-like chemotaxis protein